MPYYELRPYTHVSARHPFHGDAGAVADPVQARAYTPTRGQGIDQYDYLPPLDPKYYGYRGLGAEATISSSIGATLFGLIAAGTAAALLAEMWTGKPSGPLGWAVVGAGSALVYHAVRSLSLP